MPNRKAEVFFNGRLAGTLEELDAAAGGGYRFSYEQDYLHDDDACHVSLTLPKRPEPYLSPNKISMKYRDRNLMPTETAGEYILKPIPSAVVPAFREDIPANEHLTMQIAGQLFGIATAVNALVYLKDGEPAYLTKRFDRRDGIKIPQEDFCQLGARTEESHGKNYKYDCTCEEMGRILRRFCPAYQVEVEKLFARLLFNYVFSNGDAHLKNFSLFMSEKGDHVLTPAYDLLCTSMHFPEESRTAIELFDNFESSFFKDNGFYGAEDFLHLAELYGIRKARAEKFIRGYAAHRDPVESLIARSFLSDAGKDEYSRRFADRLGAINR